MKEDVSFNRFCDGFEPNRKDNFSYAGKRALFDYLEELEEDTGQEIEFDPVALCCEYNEYKNLGEYLSNYSTDVDKSEFEENDDLEGYEEAVMEEIRNKTTVIMVNDDSFIIQCY